MSHPPLSLVLLALVCPLLAAAGARADSIGIWCEGEHIARGATRAEVLMRCGEPVVREVVPNRAEAAPDAKAEPRVEQWTYDVGDGSFLRVLTFRGGRVVSIEDGDRR